MASPTLDSAGEFTESEKKRGDLDYDISSINPNIPGNLGVAIWDPAKGLSAKLVIGWRTRWQIDAVKQHASSARRHLQALEQKYPGAVRLFVSARPFCHRFDYQSASRWEFPTKIEETIPESWDRIWTYIDRQHGKPLLEDAELQQIGLDLPQPNERLSRARTLQCKVFTPIVVTIQWRPEVFRLLGSEAQIDKVATALADLAGLLNSLQGGPPSE